jgi:hypothetical protein
MYQELLEELLQRYPSMVLPSKVLIDTGAKSAEEWKLSRAIFDQRAMGLDRILIQTEKCIYDLVELGSSVKIGATLLRWSNGTTREFFANLEFICFLLVKFDLRPADSSYKMRDHFQKTRTKLLEKNGILGGEIRNLIDNMFDVRNAYFHSTLDFSRIEYKGGPLKQTWKQFEADSVTVSIELTAKFLKMQHLQIAPVIY